MANDYFFQKSFLWNKFLWKKKKILKKQHKQKPPIYSQDQETQTQIENETEHELNIISEKPYILSSTIRTLSTSTKHYPSAHYSTTSTPPTSVTTTFTPQTEIDVSTAQTPTKYLSTTTISSDETRYTTNQSQMQKKKKNRKYVWGTTIKPKAKNGCFHFSFTKVFFFSHISYIWHFIFFFWIEQL